MATLSDYQIFVLHGFNVSDRGAQTTDKLVRKLRAASCKTEVVEVDRDHENLLDARFKDDDVIRDIDRMYRELGCTAQTAAFIGHSHGCNIIHQYLAQVYDEWNVNLSNNVFLINPALRRGASFPYGTRVTCYHSMDDNVVLSSMALRLLPWNWVYRHPWGPAGKFGLSNTNKNRVNVDLHTLPGGVDEIGHSTVFQDDKLLKSVTTDIVLRLVEDTT